MSTRPTPPEPPTALDIVRTVALVPMAIVIATTALPGFLLCVPALIVAIALVAVPVAAILVLAAAATAIVAVPVLVVAGLRRVRWPHLARAGEPGAVAASAPPARPALAIDHQATTRSAA